MCGISGVFNHKSSKAIDNQVIIAMSDSMEHRGPDDVGYYTSKDKKIALSHCRLSIIDLSQNAHQPMSNEFGDVWITYNGEIYNYKELRTWLELKGHVFKSNSDTEVILHLYEEEGVECVNSLDGMFAFAIWDDKYKSLFLARDRVGKKPLYYTYCNGQLIFASEIKAILKHPGVKTELNAMALYDYLTLYVSVAPSTMFAGISKLEAGYRIICQIGEELKIEQYWDLFSGENVLRDLEDEKKYKIKYPEEMYRDNIQRLLTSSIQKRMMSDVPYGVFLSGGLDSSLNVALMSKISNDTINTFTVGFDNQPKYDEFNYARQIAKQFKTNHYEYIIKEQDVLDFIPDMVYYQDEPLADWVCVPLYYVSRLAAESGVKTIQLGEGSDELFFGYDGYVSYLNVYNRFWKNYIKLPKFMREFDYSIASSLSPFIGKGPGIKEIFRCAAKNEELFWGGALTFTESQKQKFVKLKDMNTFDALSPYFTQASKEKDFIHKMMYIEFKHRLPELLLMRVDKMTMANSVEGRAPYLDIDLINYVSMMPTRYKYKKGEKKYILKKVAEGILPKEIIYRKKQGFSAPVKEWFKGELGKYMINTINTSKLKELDIFDYSFIDNMIKNQLKGKSDNSARLWSLYNLSEWYKFWFN